MLRLANSARIYSDNGFQGSGPTCQASELYCLNFLFWIDLGCTAQLIRQRCNARMPSAACSTQRRPLNVVAFGGDGMRRNNSNKKATSHTKPKKKIFLYTGHAFIHVLEHFQHSRPRAFLYKIKQPQRTAMK